MCRFLAIAAVLTGCVVSIAAAHDVNAQTPLSGSPPTEDKDRPAPVDRGSGPGVKPSMLARATSALAAALSSSSAAVPNGGAAAASRGAFGAPVTWPLIAIHGVLLPDGRVVTYGTDDQGQQTGQFIYDVWDPKKGTDTSSHLVLPNTTATDIFCSAQSIISATGEVLFTGGDLTVNGTRNYSTEQTVIFDPQTNTIRSNTGMSFARWYPTTIDLPSGEILVLGGRQDPYTAAPTPEAFSPTEGWRVLPGATSNAAFGDGNWYYPKGFLTPRGDIFVLANDGLTYSLDATGSGAITKLEPQALPGRSRFPSLMFAPGKVLSLRSDRKVNVIDLNVTPPSISTTADLDQERYWANTTVLADGVVMVNGGSTVENKMTGATGKVTLWNPSNGRWYTGASAVKPRLYHSISLLLPDATVLTAGGGAPGPVKNLNAEIYYPYYLYKKDGSGDPAPRPTITGAPASVAVNQRFTITVGASDLIQRVTMLRAGSVTHSFNSDQRFLAVKFRQSGPSVQIQVPSNPNDVVPGYYMLFVLQNGVPSIARMIRVS